MRLINKFILSVFCLLSAATATASVITFNDYSYDDSTNYVTGGGLEWIRWEETRGESITTSLTNYAGYRLATETELSTLFNNFGLALTGSFDNDENTSQTFVSYTDLTLSSNFMDFFGKTNPQIGGPFAAARFGEDLDGDGDYSYAGTQQYSNRSVSFNIGDDYGFDIDHINSSIGNALVRNLASVPEPGSFFLFSIALLSMRLFSGKKLDRVLS